MFCEAENGEYQPRGVVVDHDPFPINRFLKSPVARGFKATNQVVSGLCDWNDKFGNGYGGSPESPQVFEDTVDGIRHQLEKWDNPDSIVFIQSTVGGTGSGLSSKLLISEIDDDNKINNVWVSLLPSPNFSVNHIEHYNTCLWLHFYGNFANMGIMVDNQACFRYAKEFLGMKKWSYFDVNKIIAKLYSDLTCSFRFENSVKLSLSDFANELVPNKPLSSLYASIVPVNEHFSNMDPQFPPSANNIAEK